MLLSIYVNEQCLWPSVPRHSLRLHTTWHVSLFLKEKLRSFILFIECFFISNPLILVLWLWILILERNNFFVDGDICILIFFSIWTNETVYFCCNISLHLSREIKHTENLLWSVEKILELVLHYFPYKQAHKFFPQTNHVQM